MMRMQEAGFHIDILGGLRTLKTTVLVAGGLCSKLFGIALIGYLAFQSMQANVTQQKEEERVRQQSAAYYPRRRAECPSERKDQ